VCVLVHPIITGTRLRNSRDGGVRESDELLPEQRITLSRTRHWRNAIHTVPDCPVTLRSTSLTLIVFLARGSQPSSVVKAGIIADQPGKIAR